MPLSSFCACMRPGMIERSPCVTNSVPSRPNTRRLPKCSGRIHRRRLVIDHLHVVDARRRRIVDELAARHRRVVLVVLARLGEAPVDQVVLRERGIERHVEQAALAAREHRGQSGHRRRQLAVGAEHAQPAGPLGDQHLAARQERHAPRILQAFDDGDDVEGDVELLLGRVGLSGKRRLLFGIVRRPRIGGRLRLRRRLARPTWPP